MAEEQTSSVAPRCHVIATRETQSPLWSFYFVNDGETAIESVELIAIKYEWGEQYVGGRSIGMTFSGIEPGVRALICQDDGSSETRVDLWLRIRQAGVETCLLTEFPKLYLQKKTTLISQPERVQASLALAIENEGARNQKTTVKKISFAELDSLIRRPEEWTPSLPKGVLTLRLTCRIGRETFAWVAAQAPGGKTGVVREVIVGDEAARRTMRAPASLADLTRDGLFRIKDVPVSGQVVADLLMGATAFTIPIVGRNPNMVLDGQPYRLSLESGFASAELTWSASAFTEWHPLVEWASATRRRLHEIVHPGEPLAE